ncbi:MAG: prolyl oligopeptidase family serine peptidase [Ilumatobacter sp.]|uniref:S9 family peptidase n=1 Tax=Ilumatobacter sp. TaxID=1967498 RepID=UPI00262BD0F1|nr:prolyl oligopeptidase family serine peptidase [Ilumatobacter sp.]MDJ0768817.1 prolyl oligopeptidase family serine peptidase [Ilumatobacter sp.]
MEISVEMCLAGRDLTEPRLSPDGRSVAFVVRWGGGVAIAMVPVDGGPERILTTEPHPSPGRGLGGGCFDWMPDGSGVVYAARDGDVWLQPVSGAPPKRITAVGDERRAEAPVVSPDATSVVAAVDQAEIRRWTLDQAGGAGGAADLVDGERLDDGSADFVFDPYITPCASTVLWTAWDVPDMPWDAARVERLVLRSGERDRFEGPTSVHQPRTMPDGRGVCVRDDTGWLNLWLEDAPLVDEPFEHAGPSWGMGQHSFAVSPDGSRIAFTRNERGFGRLCVVDVATRTVVEVARGVHGQLSWAGDRVVALRTGARTPTQIVAYDTADWSRTVLAVGPVLGWESAELPEPELVEVDHDGHVLHARRYVAGRGRTLCWIHGGPTDQWQVEFMPRIAYWWAQGWDVLVPDPRGSTGHGREYQQALRSEWGRLDVDDTAAVLAASHAAGRSSPATTVMMGSSSGGLTALGVLGRHAGLAAGAVVLYPVTDLAVLADESHRFEAHYTVHLVGPSSDVERYEQRSPAGCADAIDVPILVMHGDDDPVVPLSSTTSFVERVRAAGGDVELVVMEGEGHGFKDPANKRADYALTAAFLRRVLGDR